MPPFLNSKTCFPSSIALHTIAHSFNAATEIEFDWYVLSIDGNDELFFKSSVSNDWVLELEENDLFDGNDDDEFEKEEEDDEFDIDLWGILSSNGKELSENL